MKEKEQDNMGLLVGFPIEKNKVMLSLEIFRGEMILLLV